MPSLSLWASALSLLLIHDETGCPHSALNAARILEQMSEDAHLDQATATLLERASQRLAHQGSCHARTA